jgi:LEA14-like dessication related protein
MGGLVAACSVLMERPEPPRVSLAGLEIVDANLFEQRYALRLRLQNTHSMTLSITGMDYEVFLNDRPFAHGVSREGVTLLPFGEDVVRLEVVSNLADVLRQLQDLGPGPGQTLSYRITGHLKLSNWPTKIPFDYSGELVTPTEAQETMRGTAGPTTPYGPRVSRPTSQRKPPSNSVKIPSAAASSRAAI